MAGAGYSIQIDESGLDGSTVIFSAPADGGSCGGFYIEPLSGPGVLLINIPGLHGSGE